MADEQHKPFVPEDSKLKELSIKAIALGVIMAVVLGTANAYVGMKAGLTVSAVFPAAIVAMAALRVMRGNILEENMARTVASVGEALVAGAIFTIPAFVITGVWEGELDYLQSSAIMLIGGLLGVLFVTILRRSLVSESGLPFPESVAAAEIVKAGQGGQTGAGYVFGSMGIAALWELLKNPNGIHLVKDYTNGFIRMAESKVELLGQKQAFHGGFRLESPAASPMLMGVGYIVGLRVAGILFAGAIMGWLFLVPVALFLNPELPSLISDSTTWVDAAGDVWFREIRPLAVGTMIVAAFYTLYNMRGALITGIRKALGDVGKTAESGSGSNRLEKDLDFRKVVVSIIVLLVPMFFLYYHFSGSVSGSLLLTLLMAVLGFFFAAVAGYLVGLVGSSNNPISGLTLSSLLIAAILMVVLGITGKSGVAAVLGVAGIVCCTAGIAGDMMQDLKVGHLLGGTPWKMQVGELIGVIVASLVLAFPIQWMHNAYVIGSADLPAPQAGLMALMAQGIVGGEMAYPLVVAGMFLAVALILIKAPSPMLIAVGMYLPFYATSAIFVGGVIKWFMDRKAGQVEVEEERKTRAENVGILISSGLIAGESLMAVALALLFGILDYYQSTFNLADWGQNLLGLSEPLALLGIPAFILVAWALIHFPMKALRTASK